MPHTPSRGILVCNGDCAEVKKGSSHSTLYNSFFSGKKNLFQHFVVCITCTPWVKKLDTILLSIASHSPLDIFARLDPRMGDWKMHGSDNDGPDTDGPSSKGRYWRTWLWRTTNSIKLWSVTVHPCFVVRYSQVSQCPPVRLVHQSQIRQVHTP